MINAWVSHEVRNMALCVCIQVDHTVYDAFENETINVDETNLDDLREPLSYIPGRYFKVGEFNGRPCFKQEPVQHGCPNDQELVLYWNTAGKSKKYKQGWFIATSPGTVTLSPDLKPNTGVMAWLSDGEDGFPDGAVHVPAYRQVPMDGVRLHTICEWATQEIAALNGIMDQHYTTKTAEVIEAEPVQDGVAEVVEAAAPSGGDAEAVPAEPRPERQNPQTSGWFNRMKGLLKAYKNQNWHRCDLLVEEYCEQPSMAKFMSWNQRY